MEINPHTSNQEEYHDGGIYEDSQELRAKESMRDADPEDPGPRSASKASEEGTLCGLSKKMQWIVGIVLFLIIAGVTIGLTIHLTKNKEANTRNSSVNSNCKVGFSFDDKLVTPLGIKAGEEISHDGTVQFTCPTGYALKGDKSAKCINGQFEEMKEKPTCEKLDIERPINERPINNPPNNGNINPTFNNGDDDEEIKKAAKIQKAEKKNKEEKKKRADENKKEQDEKKENNKQRKDAIKKQKQIKKDQVKVVAAEKMEDYLNGLYNKCEENAQEAKEEKIANNRQRFANTVAEKKRIEKQKKVDDQETENKQVQKDLENQNELNDLHKKALKKKQEVVAAEIKCGDEDGDVFYDCEENNEKLE